MAEPEGGHQKAEVRENQREKDGDAHRRALQRISMYVCPPSSLGFCLHLFDDIYSVALLLK